MVARPHLRHRVPDHRVLSAGPAPHPRAGVAWRPLVGRALCCLSRPGHRPEAAARATLALRGAARARGGTANAPPAFRVVWGPGTHRHSEVACAPASLPFSSPAQGHPLNETNSLLTALLCGAMEGGPAREPPPPPR